MMYVDIGLVFWMDFFMKGRRELVGWGTGYRMLDVGC